MNNTETFSLEELALNRLYSYRIIPQRIYETVRGEMIQSKNKEESSFHPAGITYNFDLSNTNIDLKKLTDKLKKSWSSKHLPFSMLLYGVSGSGKSYYAKYLAQELGLGFVKKRASDLLGKLVGDTEQNIKAAFKEAEEKNAILVIDEADSMLYDRSKASQDHQVAHVNEMLVQMESFGYPFICTTNLINSIDQASFRRFVFKIKFDYLNKDKVKNCIKFFFNKSANNLKDYELVCAGDFYNIKRRLDITCDKIKLKDIEEALQEELSIKPDYKIKLKNTIGFKH